MVMNELEIFNEMFELAKHIQNHQQIIKAIMDKFRITVEYTTAVMLLIDEEEIISNVVYPSTRNFLDDSINMTYNKLPQEITKKKQLEDFKKIIYEDIDGTLYENEEFDTIKSEYNIPLTIRNKVYGYFSIYSGKKDAFNEHDKNILKIFANQTAILIDNAKLYAQTEQRIAEMSILHEVGKALNSVLNLDKLLKIIIDRSVQLARALKVSIVIYDSEKGKFKLKSYQGFSEDIPKDFLIDKQGTITGYVAEKRQAIIVTDATKQEPFCGLRNNRNYSTNSFMSFPLVIHYRIGGIIHVSNKIDGSFFTMEDFELMETFISQARAAIENALLYDEMEMMAITDGLTHIYNHRYFQEELRREIKRSNRYSLNISLIMIDIDYFKQYNDKYGHPKGDQVLKKVAALIKKTVRNVDIPARYGGEEFVVVMPETDLKDAYEAAERLRKKIMLEEFPGEVNEKVKMTVSIGVSSYKKDSKKSRSTLVEKADQALYRAKKEGRNRVYRQSVENGFEEN